jgi:hypothetical protein
MSRATPTATATAFSEGRVEQADYGWDGSNALRTVKTRYRPPGAGPYPAIAGRGGESTTDGEALARFMPVDQIETTQQGVTFTWAATAFDEMARVTDLTRASNLGMSRSEHTAYADNILCVIHRRHICPDGG